MKIVIKDNWAKNLGDVAIAESMISQMREVFPGCIIVLESSHPEITQEYFKDIKIVRRLFDVSKVKYTTKIFSFNFLFSNLPFIFQTIETFVHSILFVFLSKKKSKFEILNEIKSADLVLSAGGDFLSEKYAYRLRLFEYLLIKRLKKPLVLYAQSIGPFPKSSIPLVKYVLNKVDGIFGRDDKTISLLKEYGITSNTYHTADSVILLKINDSARAKSLLVKYKIDDNTVMIVVRDTKFTDIKKDEHDFYLQGMVETITYIQSLGLKVLFLAPNEEDFKLSQKINEKFRFNLPIVDTRPFLPSEVKFILSKIKFLISARMHPMIIASTAGTPVFSTGYEFKMRNYMKLIKMENNYMDMIPFDKGNLIFKIDGLLSDYSEVKSTLKKEIETITKLSNKNLDYLKEIIPIYDEKINAGAITIIIPIYNGESTLNEVFDSLEKQNSKDLIKEIILINDNSKDNSRKILELYSKNSSYKTMIITHDASHGLAANYNEGMKLSQTEFAILMHQDIILQDLDSFKKIIKPFSSNPSTVVTYPTILHPVEVWGAYNFWQKCLFSRLINTEITKLTGKFDCIRITKGLEFDARTYRTAGEDYDFEMKANKHGVTTPAKLKIIHLHNKSKSFSYKNLIHKESQLAECYGVNLRRYYMNINIKNLFLLLARPISILLLLINLFKPSILTTLPLLGLVTLLTYNVYIKCWKDFRIILLPFVNLVIIASYSFYMIKGFIYGKQQL